MVDPQLIRTDEIISVWTFLQSIDWHDPWLVGLIIFHVIITLMTLLTRNHSNFQVLLFLALLLLVYFSESINEIAATNWNFFSRQQYFDSQGMFISLVFSVPILLNCMIMVLPHSIPTLMTGFVHGPLHQTIGYRINVYSHRTNFKYKTILFIKVDKLLYNTHIIITYYNIQLVIKLCLWLRLSIFQSEWTTAIKLSCNTAAVRSISGRTITTKFCRFPNCKEVETLGQVLGYCPKNALLRNTRHHQVRSSIAASLQKLKFEVFKEANWLWQSSQLMTKLKRAQLRQQAQSRQQQEQLQRNSLLKHPKTD
ncbi:hypothetical protein C0J52_14546 [Blattella germanica]|nr:hypothetical protein C0J52_14546 [Blattella germanica]